MNRTELVAAVAAHSGMEETVVDRVLGGLDAALVDATRRHERVSLPGLLTLDHVSRPPRMGRNPQDGTPVAVPAAVVPKLRPGARLKEAAGQRR